MADVHDRSKESRATVTLVVVTIFTILSCVCVLLRLYTRRIILRHVATDDYMILLAQLIGLGQTAVNIIIVVVGGAGEHIEVVGAGLPTFLKMMLAAMATYNATQIATKISLLIQYGSIFPGRAMRLICHWGIGFLIVWGIIQQIISPLICSFQEITVMTPDNCITSDITVTLNAVMNMITDFLILIIPIKPVLQLQINLTRKIYLIVILGLGLGVCIISAIRLDMLVGDKYNWNDVTWEIAIVAYLSTVETSLGIACACIPTLRPLMKRVLPNMLGSSGKDTSSGGINQYGSRATRLVSEAGGPIKTKTGHNDNGIYIQKDVQFHSTTELRNVSGKGPYSASHRSSDDDMSLERAFPATTVKT